MRYKVVSNFQYSGELHKAGSFIDLDEETAAQAVESGALEVATDDEGAAKATDPLEPTPPASASDEVPKAPESPTTPDQPVTPATTTSSSSPSATVTSTGGQATDIVTQPTTPEAQIAADMAALDPKSPGSGQTPPAN